LARNPYQHEKRRKELAKQKKNEEKRERKLAKKNPQAETGSEPASGVEGAAQQGPLSPIPVEQEAAVNSPSTPTSPEQA
jgi:hypothetical protein